MPERDHKKAIAALQDLLPIEDCINCGAADDGKRKAKRAKTSDHYIPKNHPNLIG